MRVLVIGNPIAGTGRTEQRIHRFVHVLRKHGHDVEVYLTCEAGEAFERARSVDKGVERLVVAGGDGTINEVLNGLEDPARIPILHFPTGTANQLARSLGLPAEPGILARLLEDGPIQRIDMGVAGDRRFLLLVSAGFDAKVTQEIQKRRNDTLGYAGYVLPVLKTLASHSDTKLEVVLDGRQRISGYNVMVLKVREYGGLFVFADDARLDSGHFDVCVFREGTVGWLCLYAVAGLTRKASDCPGLVHFKARTVRIESEEPIPVEIDGDHFGTTPVNIDMSPSIVPVVTRRGW
ncbi:MAG: diacylglycerol kinase family lipid kinase [Desulfomonile tiedjei]|nr:diacylglycerol kinase family lipid kinase [Desulfomonile tiedjei]